MRRYLQGSLQTLQDDLQAHIDANADEIAVLQGQIDANTALITSLTQTLNDKENKICRKFNT